MREFKRRKLSRKIVLMILVTNLIICNIGCFFFYRYFSGILTEQVWKDSQTRFERMVREYDGVYQEIQRYWAQISVNDRVQRYLATEGYSGVLQENAVKREILAQLQNLVIMSESIDSIALEKRGRVEVWTKVPFLDKWSNELMQQWYESYGQAAKEEEKAGEPYSFSWQAQGTAQVSYVSVCMPVYSLKQDGNWEGSLIFNIEINRLNEILADNQDGFEGVGYLCGEAHSFLLQEELVTEEEILQGIGQPEGDRKHFPLYLSGDSILGVKLAAVCLAPDRSVFWSSDALVLILIIIANFAVSAALLIPIMLQLTKPAAILARAMQQAGDGDLQTRVEIRSKDEFQILGEELNEMISRLDTYMQTSIANEKDRHELEYEVLVAQINPHFIYNTLNTIIYLAKKERMADVVDITHAFIELLQDGLKISSENKNFSRIGEELNIIRNYICIQNYRYKDSFDVIYECPKELLKQQIPSSVIQPLVENALFHGIVPLGRPGRIWLEIGTRPVGRETYFYIKVSDEGVGIDQKRMEDIMDGTLVLKDTSRNHVGVQNIKKRLSLLYGEKYRMYMEPRKEGGTVVEVQFLASVPGEDSR